MNDLHISKDTIPEFAANWNEALEICERLDIGEIALGGDLFHSRASQTLDVLLAVGDALDAAWRRGVHITLANGNHDLVNQESLRGYCHVFNRHPNVTVVDDILTLRDESWDFALHMIAYFPERGSFLEKLDALIAGSLVEEAMNYLYIHEGINGALAQPSGDELPADIFHDFEQVFVGHYHNRTRIKGTDIHYIGSSRQHNFGEDEQKGYTIIYNDGASEFIENQANIRYQVIDLPAAKADIRLCDRLDEIRAEGRYKVKVRVHCSATDSKEIDKARLMEAGASKVEIVTEEVSIVDGGSTGVLDKYDSRRLRESYEEFCAQRQYDDVALGLDYLSKIEHYVETQ